MTLTRLAIALVAGMLGIAAAAAKQPVEFKTCEEAQQAVAAAGKSGLALEAAYYTLVFDDEACYGDPYDPYSSSFPEYREINGEQCLVGYVCIEQASRPDAG